MEIEDIRLIAWARVFLMNLSDMNNWIKESTVTNKCKHLGTV